MKKLRVFMLAIVAVVAMAVATPASAQFFRWGPRVGMNINKLSFDKEAFTNSDNRAGFTGGLMAELTVPVIGIGIDVSAMYVRRSSEWMNQNQVEKDNRDYIDIPVNLKWKINIPVVNHIVRPFVTTGPSFAFLTSKSSVNDAIHNKKSDVAWNFGAGVELLKHLQIGASYGHGLSKAVSSTVGVNQTSAIEGKNRYWTVTAAYLF